MSIRNFVKITKFTFQTIIVFGLITLALAEPPAPYPPSGWKPITPFTLPNEKPQPQQNYGPPKQEYGPPKQEYGPPKQEYGPPKQEYGPPKQQELFPPTRQELPNPDSATPWQDYGPPPSVQPSISWELPDDAARNAPDQQYGPPQDSGTTNEQPPDTNITPEDEETQRVLEQIREYQLKATRQQKLRLRNQLGRLRTSLQAPPRNQKPQRLQRARVNNRFQSGRLEQQNGGYEPGRGYLPSASYGPPVVFTTEEPTTPPTLPETTTEYIEPSTEVKVIFHGSYFSFHGS